MYIQIKFFRVENIKRRTSLILFSKKSRCQKLGTPFWLSIVCKKSYTNFTHKMPNMIDICLRCQEN